MELGSEKVNCTFKLGEVSDTLKDFILECGQMLTSHWSWLDVARINGYTTVRLWNDKTILGLQINRSYGLHVDLVYPRFNKDTYYHGQENPDIHYSTITIADFSKRDKEFSECHNVRRIDIDEWLQKRNITIEDIYTELKGLLNNDFEVLRDYDREEFEEAWELGDIDAIADIVGDRDLAEFV